jgi:2-hydroxy-3-keto-5-methylthiopentenyl-1-phosphate phosphatase
MSLIVFTDFDGTITKEDTLEMVLDRFAKQPWRNILLHISAIFTTWIILDRYSNSYNPIFRSNGNISTN